MELIVSLDLKIKEISNQPLSSIINDKVLEEIEKIADVTTYAIIIHSPNLPKIVEILESSGIIVKIPEEAQSSYKNFTNIHISKHPEHGFSITFFGDNRPSITQSPLWIRFSEKNPTSRRFQYFIQHIYTLRSCLKLLTDEGYSLIFSEDIKYLNEKIFGNLISKVELNVKALPHQIDCLEKTIQLGGKSLIGDAAGLGKTISAGLIIKHYFDKGIAKRGLWIVPTTPLIKQIVNELGEKFGLRAYGIHGNRESRLGIGKDMSIYQKEPLCVLTWGTFLKDWTDNIAITSRIPFDFIILDEVHRAQRGNVSYNAVLNCDANIRIALTGTPSPNGKFEELYNIMYVIDPFSVRPMFEYYNRKNQLIANFKKHPIDEEDPEETANRMLNELAMRELNSKLIRHTKEEVITSLPKITETQLHVPLIPSEEFIIEKLFEMLSFIIEEWLMDRLNTTLIAARDMIWQDLRRACAYGPITFKHRIAAIRNGEKMVHKYIKKNFNNILRDIERQYSKKDLREYPKFELICKYLKESDASQNVIIFCDSVKTCIDLGYFLYQNKIDTRVVTGIPDSAKSLEEEDIADFKEKLVEIGQKGKMDDDEIDDILEWFWNPFMKIAFLQDIIQDYGEVTYIIDKKRFEAISYITLLKSKEITFSYPNVKIAKIQKYVDSMIDTIREIDPKVIIRDEYHNTIITFHNNPRKNKRVLVTTNKLSEGCNLQIAQSMVFVDSPLSIRDREQRIARIQRMESPFNEVFLISFMSGLDYSIEENLKEKYAGASAIGFKKNDKVSVIEVLRKHKKMMAKESEKSKLKKIDGFKKLI